MRLRDGLLCDAILLASSSVAWAEFGFGTPATPEEIAGWNISIGRHGDNLPPGSGDTATGAELYEFECASCHGDDGEGGIGDRLVGG